MSTPAGKLENEPFSEFGLKSWKIIGVSPAWAGKAGIVLFPGVVGRSLPYLSGLLEDIEFI